MFIYLKSLSTSRLVDQLSEAAANVTRISALKDPRHMDLTMLVGVELTPFLPKRKSHVAFSRFLSHRIRDKLVMSNGMMRQISVIGLNQTKQKIKTPQICI